jgi:hypothetical protein
MPGYPWVPWATSSALQPGLLALAAGLLAQELDRHDGDDHHEGDQQGVLHQGGAALVVAEPCPQVGGEGLELGDQWIIPSLQITRQGVGLLNIMTAKWCISKHNGIGLAIAVNKKTPLGVFRYT